MENSKNTKSSKSKKLGAVTLVLTPLALAGAVAGALLANKPQIDAVEPEKAITAPSKSTNPVVPSMENPGLVVAPETTNEVTNEVTSNPETTNEVVGETFVLTTSETFPAEPEVEPDVVFHESTNLHVTEKYGHKFYTEKVGDKYRVFLYINSESIYLSAQSGFPILDYSAERYGETEFETPRATKINGIIDNFYGLFESGTTYAIYNKGNDGIFEYVTKENDVLVFKNEHSGTATKLTENTLLPLSDFPVKPITWSKMETVGFSDEPRRSVSGRAGWSGDPVKDRATLKTLKKFRKRRINIHNPKYNRHVYALKIKGTKYFMEQTLEDGYRLFIYTDNGLKYLNPKTGAETTDLGEAHFTNGSVFKIYEIAKKHRAQ